MLCLYSFSIALLVLTLKKNTFFSESPPPHFTIMLFEPWKQFKKKYFIGLSFKLDLVAKTKNQVSTELGVSAFELLPFELLII